MRPRQVKLEKLEHDDDDHDDQESTRSLGGGLHLQVPKRRRRSIPENLLTFAVIPSLLMWTVICLVVAGDFDGAVQVAGAAIAGGFVGWSLYEVR